MAALLDLMSTVLPFLPALIALGVILWTRNAAMGLASACIAGVLIISGGAPLDALRALFETHLFPTITGSVWNVSAILFTLTLGAFAGLLEKGGGFTALLDHLLNRRTKSPQKSLMFGVYGLGFVCFFDGLANALLLGRISRPLVDSLRVSRQFLAYVIDSTSAAVACVAFISTWIATQLSLINEGLVDAPFGVNPASLFLSSIPANAYCLITLMLVPLAIAKGYKPGAMHHAEAVPLEGKSIGQTGAKVRTALIPLAVLVIAVPAFIYLWQDGDDRSWRNAFSGNGVPYAMVAASLVALAAAAVFFPRERCAEVPRHMLDGAASLLPALIILLLAWTLGSIFKELGTANILSNLIGGNISVAWLPLCIFLLGAVMSFTTGTSWGTMGLLMPLALPLALDLGSSLPPGELAAVCSMCIGAVFGGAVFGDHCSPFSDTTIVSSLAAGCTPTSHVATQLPYALLAAASASLGYGLMAVGVAPGLATLGGASVLIVWVLTRRS